MLIDTIIQVPIKQDANGLLFQYDAGRSKWLSATRELITYSRNHVNLRHDQWLRVSGIPSNNNGHMVRRNAVITSLAARCGNVADCALQVRRNSNPAILSTLTLSSEQSKVDDGLDIALTAGDWLQVFLQVSSGGVNYPILTLEIAWSE